MDHPTEGPTPLRRRASVPRTLLTALGVVAGVLALTCGPALANAPNPIPGTTKLDSAVQSASGVTITVQGQWNWVTQLDCPTARDGVGYQVDWFDANTANLIGSAKSPDGILYVGDAQDNIVHSIDPLGFGGTSGNDAWDGVPSSYLSHNQSSSTPDSTDASNWVSNCNNENPSSRVSSGTWGPISHTYPAGTTSFTLCPIMYDPHGKGTSSGGVMGSSSVKDLTAGGAGHNADNSYEGNGQDNACLKSSFTPQRHVRGKKIHRHRHPRHHHHHRRRPSRRAKTPSGFTG